MGRGFESLSRHHLGSVQSENRSIRNALKNIERPDNGSLYIPRDGHVRRREYSGKLPPQGARAGGVLAVDSPAARPPRAPAFRADGYPGASRQPRWRQAPGYFMKHRDHRTLERVNLPLARDGQTVDIILGMILAHTKSGELI